jgi:hypothetical protein
MNRGDGAGEVTPWMHNSVALLGLFMEKNGPWVKLPVIIYWVTIYLWMLIYRSDYVKLPYVGED